MSTNARIDMSFGAAGVNITSGIQYKASESSYFKVNFLVNTNNKLVGF